MREDAPPPAGGVSITLMSRKEARPICMVRGIESRRQVRTSAESCTPDALLVSDPEALLLVHHDEPEVSGPDPRTRAARCVPTSTSTSPAWKSASIPRRSAGKVKRERLSTLTA